MVLAAPPAALFPSREALLAHVRAFGAGRGYAVVVHKSNVPRGQLWLRCDLSGGRRRTRRPPQPDCPFQLYARRLPSGKWALKVQNAAHSHEAEALSLHPVARRLSPEHKRLVRELTDQGLRPARILERLKAQFPGKPFQVQEIYNARNFIRRERLAGRGEETMASAAAVSELPSVVMTEAGADPRQVLQDTLGRVNSLFANWQPQVQRSFAQQLERLLETCSKQNEGLSGGVNSTAANSVNGGSIFSEAVRAELGEFGQAQEADAFLRGNLAVDTTVQGFDTSTPPELQQVALPPPATHGVAGASGDQASELLTNAIP